MCTLVGCGNKDFCSTNARLPVVFAETETIVLDGDETPGAPGGVSGQVAVGGPAMPGAPAPGAGPGAPIPIMSGFGQPVPGKTRRVLC